MRIIAIIARLQRYRVAVAGMAASILLCGCALIQHTDEAVVQLRKAAVRLEAALEPIPSFLSNATITVTEVGCTASNASVTISHVGATAQKVLVTYRIPKEVWAGIVALVAALAYAVRKWANTRHKYHAVIRSTDTAVNEAKDPVKLTESLRRAQKKESPAIQVEIAKDVKAMRCETTKQPEGKTI
jgi:hypothetical protein